MRLRIVAATYGFWLFLIFFVFYLAGGNDVNSLQYAVMLGVLPVGMQLMLLGFDPRGLSVLLKFSLALALIVLVSYLANLWTIVDWFPVITTVNVLFLLAVSLITAGCPDRRLLPALAAAYSLFTAIFLVHIILHGEHSWGRLTAGNMQPNTWGLIGLSVAVTAFGFRRLIFGAPSLFIGCWTMYDASSRSSMVALAAAILLLLCRAALELRGARLYLALAGVAAGCILVMSAGTSVDPAAADIVGNDVLKLYDPNRGLDTGFTGRSELWAGSWQLWLDHPVFGVGFRQHEQILDYPSHNAYLAMLADTGIFGFLFYCALLGGAVIAAWRIEDLSTRRLALTTLVSYAVLGFFERRAINVGNPLGFIFIMICFLSFSLASWRGAAKAAEKTALGSVAAPFR